MDDFSKDGWRFPKDDWRFFEGTWMIFTGQLDGLSDNWIKLSEDT